MLIAAAGLAIDFGRAVNARSGMQSALDAATLAVTSLAKTASEAEGLAKLQAVYAANGGIGSVNLHEFGFDAKGERGVRARADASLATSIAAITGLAEIKLNVASAARKPPTLVEARFEIVSATGWWGKTMSLYGKAYGQTRARKLLTIDYVYNKGGDPKGYGEMKVSTISTRPNGKEVATVVQTQACTTSNVTDPGNLPRGAILATVGGQIKATTCAMTAGGAAVIDVSDMEQLYLEMNIPAADGSTYSTNPSRAIRLRSDDPATSHHLYVDSVEMPAGKPVDIFSAISCGTQSTQAWEDGGSALPAPVSNADFTYKVTGRCDFSQRAGGVTLTY